MQKLLAAVMALFGMLPIPGLLGKAAELTEPATIGAIRWDAWYGEPTAEDGMDPCSQVERTLSPAKYHWRVPFFGEIGADGKVRFPEYTQEIFDREMEYAIEAGLDYFAYVWYPDIPGMERAHQYHTLSKYSARVKMCSILCSNAVNVPTVRDEIRGMLAQGYWQTVQGGRPLMFYFQVDDGAAVASDIAAYRAICAELGLPAPYAVAMSGGPEMVTKYGADAVSNYAISGSGGVPYWMLTCKAWFQWNSNWFNRAQVVPCWSAGWNALPRHDNPVSWVEASANDYVADGSPQEIARMLAAALLWCENHKGLSAANTVIGYAWNEHDEGGWLCPTLKVDSKETGVPLLNADGAYQVDDTRIQAVREVITGYKEAERRRAFLFRKICLYWLPQSIS